MEVKVLIGTDERAFEVSDDLAASLGRSITDNVNSENVLRGIAKPLVEAFYGPTPEGGDALDRHLGGVRSGKGGDKFAWAGLYDLFMIKHPQFSALRSVELQLIEGRGTPEERAVMKTSQRVLRRKVRSLAASTRSRVLRYYLSDFSPVRGIANRAKRSVRDMVREASARFERIAQHPGKHTREEASLAFMIVTMLHTAIGEPSPAPSEELADVIQRRNHHEPARREPALAQ